MTTLAPSSAHKRGTGPAIAIILAISAAATLFLFWLIYVHPASDISRVRFAYLPPLNAVMNGLSATALLVGFTFIRARRIAAHRASMIAAFIFSASGVAGRRCSPWRDPQRRLRRVLHPSDGA